MKEKRTTAIKRYRSILNHACVGGLTDADLDEYGVSSKVVRRYLIAEGRELRRIFKSGNQGIAHERAREAAETFAGAFPSALGDEGFPDPRDIVERVERI
jgi:hypothetical protein